MDRNLAEIQRDIDAYQRFIDYREQQEERQGLLTSPNEVIQVDDYITDSDEEREELQEAEDARLAEIKSGVGKERKLTRNNSEDGAQQV